MSHIRGIKGEAVVVYCEPLITKEVGYHHFVYAHLGYFTPERKSIPHGH